VVPIVLALACAVVYGIADYCGGRSARSASSLIVSLIGQATSLVVGLVVVIVVGTAFPPLRELAWGGLAGVASAVALGAFYHALSHGSMTVVAPITAVTSAVLPVAFGLIRGERPAAIAYLGMVLAVAAIALVSGAVGARHVVTRRSTIGFALLGGVGFAVIFIALGETVAVARRVSGRGAAGIWKLAASAGALDMSANFLYLIAVRRGLLSVVVVVVALYPLSTVLLAFGVDKERVSRSQAFGMAMAVGALVLVSVAGAS